MAKLRWGLIGASTIAAEHMISAFRANGGEAVVVMSANADRGASYAKKHGIARATTSLKELVKSKEVDAVYISTTNELHRGQLFAAAAAGKHVLCEKPLALTLADARAMVAECRKHSVVMGTNHHLRNAATHRAMREAIKEGRIGSRFSPASSIPSICLLIYRGGDGNAAGAGGMLAQFHDGFTTKYATTGFEVHGKSGSLIGRDCMTQEPKGEVLLRTSSGDEALKLDHEKLYVRSIRLFQEAILGRGAPSATGEDGVKSLSVAISALKAARSGTETAIDLTV